MQTQQLILKRVERMRFDILFLWKREKVLMKLLQKIRDLNRTVSLFNGPEAPHDFITQAGELFTLVSYGAPKNEKFVNNFRFTLYKTAARKNRAVNLASIPPTREKLCQHSCRAFRQIQEW